MIPNTPAGSGNAQIKGLKIAKTAINERPFTY